MRYEIKLDIKDYATLKFYTESEKIKSRLINPQSSIRRTIPITDASFLEVDQNDICYYDSIIITNSDNKNMFYDKTNNTAILNVNENELRFPDLIYVSLAMFSKILARKEKYLLHSSSVVNSDNEGIVLVGDANSGKTSLAYELMSKHDCKLISNDHSIIGIEDGKPKILGGTKEIQMRLGAIELYFPELYQKINVQSDDKWNERLVVNDFVDPKLILENDQDKTNLRSVFSINTANSSESFLKAKENTDQFLFLYDNMSRIIKGSYHYIVGLDYPMPSMEDAKMLRQLSSVCKVITSQCDVNEVKGSVKDVAKMLVNK